MNPEFDEVLLTAYLDDEVSDAEREAVEEQLRTSESSRKLLEELRSVRNLVMQLHQAQPSRSFKSGPWNASALNGDSAKVVLHELSGKWSWSYQKLASIAALIAIAMCIRVLILQHNGMFISRSEKTKTDAGIELQVQIAPIPNDPTLSLQTAESGEPIPDPIELDDRLKPGANPTSGGLAKSEAAVATSRDNATTVRGAAGASQSAPGGFGAPPARAQANFPMAKKRSEEVESIALGDPAPAVTAPPSFGLPTPETAATSNTMDLTNAMNPMVQSLLKSLLVDSPNDPDRWVDLNTLGDMDRSLARAAHMDGAAEPQSLGQSLAMDSKMVPNTDSMSRYSFRYQRATEKEKVADSKGMLSQNKPMTSQATDLFMQSDVDGRAKASPIPFLIEFQIPREDWAIGVKRLRDLGIGVPMELPSLNYVDFTVTPVPTKDPVEAFDKAGANNSLPVTRWLFQQVEPKERPLASASPKAIAPDKTPPTAGRERTDAPSVLRLRVRAVKQQE